MIKLLDPSRMNAQVILIKGGHGGEGHAGEGGVRFGSGHPSGAGTPIGGGTAVFIFIIILVIAINRKVVK